MVVDKVFQNTFKCNYTTFPNYNDAYEATLKLANKIIGRTDEMFVVEIINTDEVGKIYSEDVYISETYLEVANLIASKDYEKMCAVEVYAVHGNTYASIKSKTFDGICYSSYAGCTLSTCDPRFVIRHFWDRNTTFHY